MTSPGETLWEFCGFSNGSTFRTKYFMDESTMTLTPCAELGIMLAESLPMLVAFVISFFMLSSEFPRIELFYDVHRNFAARCYICLITVLGLSFSIILSFFLPIFHLKGAYIVEYSILLPIWMVSGSFWTASCLADSWSSSTLLSWTTFFGTKIFHMIAVNRVMLYGWGDPRAIIALVMSLSQIGYGVTKIVDWKLRKNANPHTRLIETDIQDDVKVDEGCSLLSKIFFIWTNPLVKKGSKLMLNQVSDLFQLPPSLNVENIEKKFIECSPTLFSDGEQFKVHKALFNTFGTEFLLLGLLRFASDVFTFTGPILLHLLVEAFSQTEPTDDAYYLTMLTIICQFFGAMFSTNFTYYTTKIGLKVRTALVTSIYDRLLSTPMSEMSANSGKLINFITTDVDRIVNFTNSFHAAWSLPLQAIVGIYLLYREIGLAVGAGVLCAFILIPVNNYITKQIGKMSEKFMAAKDQRMKLTSEVVRGFRVVKMSGTEDYFEKKIVVLRIEELKYLKIRKYLDALCVYFWASAPLLITISILVTHTVFLHERLTAAKVFPVLALVNILIMPLNAMPWVFNGLIEARVSLRRLQKFYRLKQMDFRDVYSKNDNLNTLLSVVNGTFSWKDCYHSVKGVRLEGREGQVIGISGDVGAGKSTLLLGLLGETQYAKDTIATTQHCIDHGIGYMGQERWLIRGTVRENILAGKAYDEILYQEVLKGSCLRDDIKFMPGGDSYMISDNGASLSGGQRTRLALARALYQDNSVYILDEPFASLDNKVAHTIYAMAIEPMKGRKKLVIIATHDEELLARLDHIVMIDKHGNIEAQGPPRELLNVNEQPFEGVVDDEEVVVDEVHTYERVAPREEERQTGAVKANVYKTYARSVGNVLSVMVLISLVTMQVSKNGADWWLSKWTEDQGNFTTVGLPGLLYGERPYEYNDESDQDKAIHFLKIYAYIALANTLFTLARSFLFAYGGLRACKELHASLLTRILQSTVDWLDRTPSGRIINRLCADVYTVDDSLPFIMNIFFATFVNLVGSIVVTLMGLPYIGFVYAFLGVIYYFIQKHYRRTTVELKRLCSLSLSPFFSHVTDTVNGLVVIRAQRFTRKFHKKMRTLLTNNMRTQFSALAASQWLNIRLSMLAIAVIATISFGAIIQHRIDTVNSGLVGLSITYALALTAMLNGLLSSFIETEKEMVAVERIEEYIDDLPEEHVHGKEIPLSGVQGRIELKDVSLKYDAGLPLALNKVSLVIDPGMKVAIMGRTGSGKSSIFACLLRTARMNNGHITIDGVDIQSLSLPCLRSIFGVIPQHPFIFSGSLYDNLTLYCKNPDLNQVLHVCRVGNLNDLITRIGDVHGIIAESGDNLSFGEKQIISFCRVLLARPRIILIDEGTSHLDEKNHSRLFSLLTTLMPGTTLLSIIHKTSGLDKYDMFVQMSEGHIISQKSQEEILAEQAQQEKE